MRKLFSIIFSLQLMVTPVLSATNLPGTEEDKYLTEGTGKKNGGFDFYLRQVLVLGTSTVGANIITQCPMGLIQPSIGIFMGGSLIHIMSEILGAKAKNESHKRKLKELKLTEAQLKRTGDVSQKAIMEQQLVEEQETRKFLKDRKLWMAAVTTVYGAATAFAIGESITAPLLKTECVASDGLLAKGLGMLVVAGYGLAGQSGGALSQYGTMLSGALNLFIPKMTKVVKVAYEFPQARIITFGASTLLGASVAYGFETRQDKADENIKKLKSALASFKADTDGLDAGIVTGPLPTEDDDSVDPKKKKYDLKTLSVNQKKECFSRTGGTWTHSASACSSPVKLAPVKVGKFSLPAISNVSRLTTDLGNALAEGDDAKAGLIAGEIGSYAARVEAEKNALKKQFDELHKKDKNPFDIDKSVSAKVASLSTSLKDTGALKGIESSLAGTKSDSETFEKANSNVSPSSSPIIDLPGGDSSAVSTEDVVAELPVEQTPDQSLEDFESPVQDVSKESEVSIFKQVSNRYILNYTKMFERRKGLDDSGQAPTN